jgi:uncharacterized RDD family membrane protein YckC
VSQLVTGEAVALDLRPAALPSRLVAGFLDALAQLLVLAVVGGIATAVSLDLSTAAVDALSILTLVLVLIVYPVTFETLLRGRTPGKAVMGLRVVRDDGGPIGFRQALVRGLTGAFIERPGITFFVGGVVTSLLNPQGKRIGDLLAGTTVLQERVSVRGGEVATMPPPLAPWAAGLDLSRLSDDLALSARAFLARSAQLTDASREELGGRLVRAVVDAVGPPPPGTPGWAVLSAVLAERRRREYERLAGARPGAAQPAPSFAPVRVAQPVPPALEAAELSPPGGAPSQAAMPWSQGPASSQGPAEQPPAVGPGGFIAPS